MFGIQFSPFQASDLCAHQCGAVLEIFRTVRCPDLELAIVGGQCGAQSPRERERRKMTTGTTYYVKVVDPKSGTVGYLPIEPAAWPHSSMRFHKGRPPQGGSR